MVPGEGEGPGAAGGAVEVVGAAAAVAVGGAGAASESVRPLCKAAHDPDHVVRARFRCSPWRSGRLAQVRLDFRRLVTSASFGRASSLMTPFIACSPHSSTDARPEETAGGVAEVRGLADEGRGSAPSFLLRLSLAARLEHCCRDVDRQRAPVVAVRLLGGPISPRFPRASPARRPSFADRAFSSSSLQAMGCGIWLFCPEIYDVVKYRPRTSAFSSLSTSRPSQADLALSQSTTLASSSLPPGSSATFSTCSAPSSRATHRSRRSRSTCAL